MKKELKTAILFILLFNNLFSQAPKKYNFTSPVDFPMHLSGTFGELRPNHFHTGIDIRTSGVIGKEIKSIADGYVERISVSPYGYGKVIYIRHPEGLTSVYAHLEKFSPTIEKFVKDKQYAEQRYDVNIFPKENELPVKQKELIGISGNSGGSQGPHLHFEVRDSKSQQPINPFLFDFRAEDKKKPLLQNVVIYSLDSKEDLVDYAAKQKLKFVNNKLDKDTIEINSKFLAIGAVAIDQIDNSNSKNGVYKILLYRNENLWVSVRMDTLNFSEQKFLNAYIDYPSYIGNKSRIQKLFKEPGNDVSIFNKLINKGFFELENNRTENFTLVVEDFEGNKTQAKFVIKTKIKDRVNSPRQGVLLDYTKENNVVSDKFNLQIPKGALYNNIYFEYQDQNEYIVIGNEEIALLSPYTLRVKLDSNSLAKKDKLSLARVSANGYKVFLGGKVEGDYMVLKSKVFGKIVIASDNNPPKITPLNISQGKSLAKQSSIRAKIKDSESGIKSYNAYIDGTWILMEYDAKNDLLKYDFSDIVLKGKKHKFTLEVVDNVDNISKVEIDFYR